MGALLNLFASKATLQANIDEANSSAQYWQRIYFEAEERLKKLQEELAETRKLLVEKAEDAFVLAAALRGPTDG